jgi:hypothetical protein
MSAFTLIACSDDDEAPLPPTQPPVEEEQDVDAGPTSPNPRVRFKGPQRLQMELGRVLDFEQNELCNELGLYDCVGVHNVALGGVDPFGTALYEANETSTATTTLAVERLVLAGCIERAKRDMTTSSSVIYAGLDDNELDVASQAFASAVDTLYTRALQRHHKPAELDHLSKLYSDIAANSDAEAPGREWATLSCFTVLTSLEFLFY